MSLEQPVKFLGGQDGVCFIHMFVESRIFDLRSRATRSEQMLKTLRFQHLCQDMIENTFLSLAWFSSCLVQTTWSSTRTITLSKLSLIPNAFGHDNRYLLQLILEMHKKLQTSKLEFGLNSKAIETGYPSLT